jgi:hypothetical protein
VLMPTRLMIYLCLNCKSARSCTHFFAMKQICVCELCVPVLCCDV